MSNKAIDKDYLLRQLKNFDDDVLSETYSTIPVEMTQAQYDALTQEEKMNGTIYLITDASGGGGGTSDYTELDNKPQINGTTLTGNKTAAELGLVEAETEKGLSTNDFTDIDKDKLDGIAAGAEVNVQPDWNESDSESDAFIKNKPTIPAAQVNADWDASSGTAQILHKPTLGTAAAKNSTSSVIASSTDLVESGAVAAAIGDKANKVSVATSGNFASLTSAGDIADSGKKASDFLSSNTPIPDEVTANPQGTATGTLTKLGIGSDIYDIQGSGGTDKADISAIGTNETGTTASKAYAIGEHFYKNGKFCTAKTAIASGATFTLGTNYVEGTVADFLLSYSEQEQFTGEYWLDGKPIYKKTFVYSGGFLIPPNTWTDVNTGISYIKKIVRAEAVNINADQAMNFISAKIDTGTGKLSVLSTRTVDVTLGALTAFYMKS